MKAIRHRFNGPTTPISSYDQTKTSLGSLMYQYSGVTNEEVFVGPSKIGLAKPAELGGVLTNFQQVIRISDTLDWVFIADNSTAAATRRILLYTYNRTTTLFNYMGFVTLTYPIATVHTIRGFRVIRELYTDGTVTVVGTSVTGSGTSWVTDRMSVGSRIGFGSTNPNDITTWYEIGAIVDNTTITLTTSATIPAGTPYVIEDIMLLTSNTNATVANGGLFVTKGIRPEIFVGGGTIIPAATTIDNIRAVYWLADAAVVTNTATGGCAYGNKTSWVAQSVYCINVNAATTPSIFVYNVRAPLTLITGKDATTLLVKTGVQTVGGTVQQNNNGRFMTMNSGPGAGLDCFYFVTTTRIYRVLGTNIVNSSTTWLSDFMIEQPPGSTNSFAVTNALWSFDYIDILDKLVITSSGLAGVRSYITDYQTLGNQFQHIFLEDDKQLDQSIADIGLAPHPNINALPFSPWSEGGLLYLLRVSAANNTNQIYTIPVGADFTYGLTTNQMVITPRMDVSDSSKLYNATVSFLSKLGSDKFALPPEGYKLYYRTTGISDNTGAWTLLDETGSLDGVVATDIQFGLTFKTIGGSCIPSRIFSIVLTYEGDITDSHYTPSIGTSSLLDRRFGYRQSSAFGTNIPVLKITLVDASNGAPVLIDNSASNTAGLFEYSNNAGVSWLPWNATQDVIGNYIRYTATSLPNALKIKATLTQL